MARLRVTSCARLHGVLPGNASESVLENEHAIARPNPSLNADVPHAGAAPIAAGGRLALVR